MTQPAAARSDKFGNRTYEIPNPDTGEAAKLWSITRIQGLLDKPALTTWKMKMVASGLAKRSDLVVLAATDPYNASEQAIDAGKDAANMGTGIHALTELADDGTLDIDQVPTAAQQHLTHYIDAMDRFGWTVVAAEQTVCHHGLGYAGTFDRIIDLPGLGRVVADIKTGKGVYPDVAYQLAALAGGLSIWDSVAEQHLPMPDDLRRDIGVVIHLTTDGCRLVPVNLDVAWDHWVSLCGIRRFQTDVSPLGGDLEPHIPSLIEDPEDREVWIRERVSDLIRAGHAETLAQHWPADLPTLKDHNPTPGEIDDIATVCDLVEANEDQPWGTNDPQHTTNRETADNLVWRLSELPEDLLLSVTLDAQRHKIPNLRTGQATTEQLAQLNGWTKAVEASWQGRNATIDSLAQRLGDHQWTALLAAVGGDVDRWTLSDVEVAEVFVRALEVGIVAEVGGRIAPADDALDRLVATHGGKREVLNAAKAAADTHDLPKPSSSADAAEDPLIVALVTSEATAAA